MPCLGRRSRLARLANGWLLALLAGIGCARPSATDRPFTIVMLPDTQIYAKRFPEIFHAQTQWIRDHRDRENIVFVTQVGDIINDHDRDKDLYQWATASKAMATLDGVVPWGVAIGNHDYDQDGDKEGKAELFLRHFGPQRFAGRPWFGGATPNGLSTCQLFSGGGIDFIIFHLQIDAPDDTIRWVKEMLARHPTRAAILSMHIYMKGRDGVARHPKRFGLKDGNSPQVLWDRLIRSSPQIFMVLCGHEGRTDEYRQISTNDEGRPVLEILADYQKRERGGHGFLRLMRFDPDEKTIRVQTYSPVLQQFERDETSEFDLPWALPAASYAARYAARGLAGVPRPEPVVRLPETLTLELLAGAEPTLEYAAERGRLELERVHGRKVSRAVFGGQDGAAPKTGVGAILLAVPRQQAGLAEWCRAHGLRVPFFRQGDQSYRVLVSDSPARVVVLGSDAVGAWYGLCAWLDRLRNGADGALISPVGEISSAPELAIRYTRDCVPGASFGRIEEALPALDWWARWRMNTTRIGQWPEPLTRRFLEEAHLRGIRVHVGLGVRNLCASDERAVDRCAADFERFLQLGGDGTTVLWDDLPHERCAGHCDRCRARFGPDGLPREIVEVLEALCDVAARHKPQPEIIWCPPHYSRDRYPELSDEAFFEVIGRSQKVREHTRVLYCEFDPRRVELLDRFGLQRRVWWYNGMRSLYQICSRWAPPEMRLSIPGLVSFPQPEFGRFEWGWLMDIGARPDGSIALPSEQTRRALRSLSDRYDGYYPCMDTHPYHAAVSGLYAWAPQEFDQDAAEAIVFRSIFGPGSEQVARHWSDLYGRLQVRLARAARPAGETDPTPIDRALREWRTVREQVEATAAGGHGLLDPTLLESVLARMREAENHLVALAQGPARN